MTISPSKDLGVGVTAYLTENGRIVNNNGGGGSVYNAADLTAGSARIGYIYAYDSTNNQRITLVEELAIILTITSTHLLPTLKVKEMDLAE